MYKILIINLIPANDIEDKLPFYLNNVGIVYRYKIRYYINKKYIKLINYFYSFYFFYGQFPKFDSLINGSK